MINENNIPQADELKVNILVLPKTIINFKKMGILMISKSSYSNKTYAVEKAKYLGNGKWESIDKKLLKKLNSGGKD